MAWDHINEHRKVSFWTNIRYDAVTGCWNWTGSTSSKQDGRDYGKMRYLGKMEYVHRLSAHFYLKFDLNSPLKVLHHCDNPACFNPKHLFVGTQIDNALDAIAKGRLVFIRTDRCRWGHPLTQIKSVKYVRGLAHPRFYCRVCARKREKVYRERKCLVIPQNV